jgi:hypothetical protein
MEKNVRAHRSPRPSPARSAVAIQRARKGAAPPLDCHGPAALAMTKWAQNLKCAFAAALLCLCSAVLAAPENPPSAPAGKLDTRFYSLGEFNRLGAGVYWVEAYIVMLDYPQCKSPYACFPILALISDAPRGSCENGNIDALEKAFEGGEMNSSKRKKAALNQLNKACSGNIFRLLKIKRASAGGRLFHESANRLNGRLRLRIRVQDGSDGSDASLSRNFALLEDFCAGADDCPRLYSLGEFNQMNAAAGVYRVEAYTVALDYQKCESPPCPSSPPLVRALISSTPRNACANGKIETLFETLREQREDAHVKAALNELSRACSGSDFRLLDVSRFVQQKFVWQKVQPVLPDAKERARFYIRIRAQDGSDNYPPPGHFAIWEDFCAGTDCEKP